MCYNLSISELYVKLLDFEWQLVHCKESYKNNMLGSKLTTLVCVWPLDLVNVVPVSIHVCIDLVVHYIPRLTIAWNGMLYPSIINLGRLGYKLHNIEGSNPLKGTSFYGCVLNVGHTFWVLYIFSCKVLCEEFILMLVLGVQGFLVWWCLIKPLCQETCNNFVALGKKNSNNNLKVL